MNSRITLGLLAGTLAIPIFGQPAGPNAPFIPPTVVVQPLPDGTFPPPNAPARFNPAQLITPPEPVVEPPAPPSAPEPPPSTLEKLRQTIDSLELQVNALRQMLTRSSGSAAAPTQLAITAFRRGRDLADQRLHRAAIEAFSEAILLDPGNDSAFLLRGEAYQQLGDFTNAEADFTRSLALQANNSRAYVSRASVRSAQGKIGEAFADANQALTRDPLNLQARLVRARLYELGGDVNSAIADYSAALGFGPSEPALLGRATAYLRGGQFALAANDCEAARRVNPNAPLAHLCMAEVHLRQNSVQQAVASLNNAMFAAQATGQPLPVLPQLPVMLAQTIAPTTPATVAAQPPAIPSAPVPPAPVQPNPVQPPAPAPAKPEAPVLIAAAPKPVEPKPAPVQPKPAQPKPAAPKPAPAKPVAKPEPESPTATQLAKAIVTQNYSSLRLPTTEIEKQARALTDQHRYDEALPLLNQVVTQSPKYAKGYNARGFVHLLKGSYKEAIADFTEAIRLNPNYANAFHNRAVALRKLSDDTAADRDEENASRLLAASYPAQ